MNDQEKKSGSQPPQNSLPKMAPDDDIAKDAAQQAAQSAAQSAASKGAASPSTPAKSPVIQDALTQNAAPKSTATGSSGSAGNLTLNTPLPRQPKPDSSLVSRRELIGLMVGAGATFVLATTLAQPLDTFARDILNQQAKTPDRGNPNYHWGMVIDLSTCIGCDYCVYACQATNDTRDDMRWNIRVTDSTAQGKEFFVTRPCMHCQEAPCVEVCPVGATYSRADGLVVMDYDKCIGCRYCQTACPYGARQFNWSAREDVNPRSPEFGKPEVPRRARGVMEKCTFCIHRIDAGLAKGLMPGVDLEATPACVNICPVKARHFGNLNDPESPVSKIINSRPTLRLREDLGTEPSVYYIPPEGLI